MCVFIPCQIKPKSMKWFPLPPNMALSIMVSGLVKKCPP